MVTANPSSHLYGHPKSLITLVWSPVTQIEARPFPGPFASQHPTHVGDRVPNIAIMVLENGYTLGFIGAGNMGTAVLSAAVRGAAESKQEGVPLKFIVSVKSEKSRARLRAQFSETPQVLVVDDNQTVIDESHVVVLAIKPFAVKEVLGRLHYPHFTVLVSLLAGTSIDTIRQYTSVNAFIVRATTNMAAQIGCGMTALSFQGEYNPDSPIMLAVEWLFTQTGKYIVIDESKQNACVALCGSGPAFTYLFADALIDGGVKMGLPAETARQCAAQVLLGSAQLILDGGHPAVLKNAVMTPGGTTINGLSVLEDGAVRGHVIHAVEKSTQVAQQLAEQTDAPPRSIEASRHASAVNLAEMAQQISLSRRNTLNRQPTLP